MSCFCSFGEILDKQIVKGEIVSFDSMELVWKFLVNYSSGKTEIVKKLIFVKANIGPFQQVKLCCRCRRFVENL